VNEKGDDFGLRVDVEHSVGLVMGYDCKNKFFGLDRKLIEKLKSLWDYNQQMQPTANNHACTSSNHGQ
jgi:hypothetical protein